MCRFRIVTSAFVNLPRGQRQRWGHPVRAQPRSRPGFPGSWRLGKPGAESGGTGGWGHCGVTPGDTSAAPGGGDTPGLGTRTRCHLRTHCPSVAWSSGSLSWKSMMSSRLWTYLGGTRSSHSWHPQTQGTPQVTPRRARSQPPQTRPPTPKSAAPGVTVAPPCWHRDFRDTWGHGPSAGGWLWEGWHSRTPWHGLTPRHGRIPLAAAQDTGQTTRHVVAPGEGSRCWHWHRHRDTALKGTLRPPQDRDPL